MLVALLEVVPEPRLAGGEQHSRRGVHAYAPSDLRVSVLAHRRAGRAIGILVRMQPQVSIARRRGLQATLGEDGIVRTEDYRSICQRPHRASGGDGPRLARPVRRDAVGQVRPIGPVMLLAGRVAESAGRFLDRQHPLESPPRLVEEVRDPVARLGDVAVVACRGKVAVGLEEPEERGRRRGVVDGEIAGVVPPLRLAGRSLVRVARVDPGPLRVRRFDGGEGALEVQRPLHGPHGVVEHVGADVEGMTRETVVRDDAIAARRTHGTEVADPHRPDGAEDVGGDRPDGWTTPECHGAVPLAHHLEVPEGTRGAELLPHRGRVPDLRCGEASERRFLGYRHRAKSPSGKTQHPPSRFLQTAAGPKDHCRDADRDARHRREGDRAPSPGRPAG